jgi:hypothetical protein
MVIHAPPLEVEYPRDAEIMRTSVNPNAVPMMVHQPQRTGRPGDHA